MARVNVLILRAAGTNCDLETQFAWERAGARAERRHVRELVERPALLADCQVLTIPGGFSYGDDIAAGRIFATQLKRHLLDDVRRLIERGGLVLGICNGFQVLVTAGLLPYSGRPEEPRRCTITYNDPPGFQDRWVALRADTARCPFLEKGRTYALPIAHGEGRFVCSDEETLNRLLENGHAALRYVPPPPRSGVAPGDPANPNGSQADIAGLIDETGRVLGLMPHPERFVSATQHPCWTSRPPSDEGDGLALFRSAVRYFD